MNNKQFENLDRISCKGFSYDCNIGFHPVEQGLRQKIVVDFKAWVLPLEKSEAENASAVRLDYFMVNRLIGELVEKENFMLLESMAESVANLILDNFSVHAVEVSVTKFPVDMPNARSVSYVCYRKHKNFNQHGCQY